MMRELNELCDSRNICVHRLSSKYAVRGKMIINFIIVRIDLIDQWIDNL